MDVPTGLDCYEILGLERTASDKEIRAAYLSLLKVWHPDVCAPELRTQALSCTQQLNLAYEVLRVPVLRKEYDQSLPPEPPRPYSYTAPPRPPRPQATHRPDPLWRPEPFSPLPPFWFSPEDYVLKMASASAHPDIYKGFLAFAASSASEKVFPASLPSQLRSPLSAHEGFLASARLALKLPLQYARLLVPELLTPVSLIRSNVPTEALFFVEDPKAVRISLAELLIDDLVPSASQATPQPFPASDSSPYGSPSMPSPSLNVFA